MNIYHLKYFYDAATHSSLTRSAEINRVSQSAITQAIIALEQVFNCSLVGHERKKISLTPKGKILVSKIPALLKGVSELKEILDQEEKIEGYLKLGTLNSLLSHVFQKPLQQMRKKYPLITPQIKLGNSDQIITLLEKKEIDFGIMIDDKIKRSLNKKIIKQGYFVAIMPKNKNIENLDFIVTRQKKYEVKEFKKLLYKKFKIKCEVRQEILSWEAIKTMVQCGYGWGLVPDYLVDSSVLVIKEYPKIPYDLVCISSLGEILNKKNEAFLELAAF